MLLDSWSDSRLAIGRLLGVIYDEEPKNQGNLHLMEEISFPMPAVERLNKQHGQKTL